MVERVASGFGVDLCAGVVTGTLRFLLRPIVIMFKWSFVYPHYAIPAFLFSPGPTCHHVKKILSLSTTRVAMATTNEPSSLLSTPGSLSNATVTAIPTAPYPSFACRGQELLRRHALSAPFGRTL